MMNYEMTRTNEKIFSPEKYSELYQNQIKANSIYCELMFNLKNNKPLILNELREYLKLDNDFDVSFNLDTMFVQFILHDINCEIVVYLDIVIKVDKRVISKREQLFFYICNDKIELDVI